MPSLFPSAEWIEDFKNHLNEDEQYNRIAANWEGDLLFDIQACQSLPVPIKIYLDLWHGKCRDAYIVEEGKEQEAAFVLTAVFDNFARVLKGDLDPMQALLTRKLNMKGSMPYIMRNVPVVLDFVRCARDVTDKVAGEA